MTFQEHLATDIEKIQSGVSLRNARIQSRRFLSAFVDSEALDVDLILGFALGLSRVEVLTSAERVLSRDECERVAGLLMRRSKSEPIAYITGEKEFFGLSFIVNKDVLIPRPDTELLVETSLRALKSQADSFGGPTAQVVIDVCTGSGCVAIAISNHVESARVIASDLSEKALAVATENAKRLGVQANIDFRTGHLLESCADMRDVDLIVSNPPYIRPVEMAGLMADVRDFEPEMALKGDGLDGLGLHREILTQSLPLLRVGGVLLMEIVAGQAEILIKETVPGFSSAEFLKDYAGILRVVKYSRLPCESKLNEGVING